MRAFHMAWFAFFLCFFGWFGIVPLMKGEDGVIADLGLTPAQVGNLIIAANGFRRFSTLPKSTPPYSLKPCATSRTRSSEA